MRCYPNNYAVPGAVNSAIPGILQGILLSPTWFLLVIDSLLKFLESNCLGPEVDGHFVGAFTHVNDIRTICGCRDTLDRQIVFVEKFVSAR